MIRFDEERLGSNNQEEVRLAINPTALQRFCGTGYYYYDDIPVPYQALLDEERLLLPSQQCGFDELFIRFCARLAKHQAEFHRNLKLESWILAVAWVIAVVILIVGTSDEDKILELLPIFPIVGFLPLCLPLGAMESFLAQVLRGFHSDYQAIQDLVDEMTPLFREHGYNVDYVQDNQRGCPSLMYVRFSRNKTDTKEIPLAQTLQMLQQQTRTEHTEALITK